MHMHIRAFIHDSVLRIDAHRKRFFFSFHFEYNRY